MSALSRRAINWSRVSDANRPATALSVAARLVTRTTMLQKRGSSASFASAITIAQNTFHSRSLSMNIRMSLPSFEVNAP